LRKRRTGTERSPSGDTPALKNELRLHAFAKINAGLKILGRRPDGYHEIRTVYQTIALHDRLEIRLTTSPTALAVECAHTAVPSGRDNLVYRACELWRRARRWHGGIRVRIEKVIPLGSGLGGASADAAAALLGLERLTGDRLDFAGRHRLAGALGSDVPLFLLGGRVLGCGRGEEVYPLSDLPLRACLVVFPGFSVSTAEAYRQAGSRLTEQPRSAYIGSFGAWPQLPLMNWGSAENDFESVVFARWPELARVKRRLIRAGAEVASLTGSGSAVYGLFSSARQLLRASQLIPRGWLCYRTRTLTRAGYHRRLYDQ
jgi:4-diphosphocytidyl-2-C-methyl-D-erythritol kinase